MVLSILWLQQDFPDGNLFSVCPGQPLAVPGKDEKLARFFHCISHPSKIFIISRNKSLKKRVSLLLSHTGLVLGNPRVAQSAWPLPWLSGPGQGVMGWAGVPGKEVGFDTGGTQGGSASKGLTPSQAVPWVRWKGGAVGPGRHAAQT